MITSPSSDMPLSVTSPRKARPAARPSVAQFAINQVLHRHGVSSGAAQANTKPVETHKPLTVEQPPAATLAKQENAPLRSLSIYRDSESGKFISIVRNVNTGEVIEQIPEEKMRAFYSRLQQNSHLYALPQPGSVLNVEA